MKRVQGIAALAAILAAVPAQAMSPGATVLPYGNNLRHDVGVGVSVGIKIQLGSDHNVKKSERVTLKLGAGPVMTVADPFALDGFRRSEASLIGLDIRPGYSTKLNFAGQPMLVDYTRLGAAEKDDENEDKQSTGDKIAWVAAVAGGVIVVFIGAVAVHCSQQEGNSCSE